MDDDEITLIRERLRTPRAAAIAGFIFSILLMTSQILVWITLPKQATTQAAQIVQHSQAVLFALNLLPLAGVAFLWFIAVVRDHLGEQEDRFFTTVFLGSGLLYIAMIFIGTAIAGALVSLLLDESAKGSVPVSYLLVRAEVYRFMSQFATKMAAVFMMSGSTIFIRTRLVPRWLALVGYAAAAGLLLSVGIVTWIPAVFPVWVMLVSGYILFQNRLRWNEQMYAKSTALK